MLLPYSTERELRRVPYATIILIVINIWVAGITWSDPGLFRAMAINPCDFGWWQPLTATLLHTPKAGLYSLLFGMLLVWIFGSHVEDIIGPWKFLLLYFCGGLIAGLAWVAWSVVCVGYFCPGCRGGVTAAGCLMALVALFVTRFRNVKVNFAYFIYYAWGTGGVAAIWVGAIWLVTNVILGIVLPLSGNPVAIYSIAHVASFATGLTWAYLLSLHVEARADETGAEAARLAASGIYEMAAVTVEQEIQRRPGDPELHCKAASYYEMKPQTRQRAIEHWNMALGLWLRRDEQEAAFDRWDRLMYDHNPQQFDPDIICDLAVARENAGQFSAAADIYAVVANDHAASRPAPLAALRLARLLGRMGDADLARQWYQTVIERWPDSNEVLDARDGLAQLGRE